MRKTIKRFFRRLFLPKVNFLFNPGDSNGKLESGYLLGYTSVVTEYEIKAGKAEHKTLTHLAIVEPAKPDQDGVYKHRIMPSSQIQVL